MNFRKSLIFWPAILFISILQGCSNSSDKAQDSSSDSYREFRQKDQQPIEVKTLGALINDDAGMPSLENTGLKWKTVKDKLSIKEFYQEAFGKGCFQTGQPHELLQIDPDLKVGQKFGMIFRDIGQSHEILTVKRRIITHIDRSNTELIYSSEFLQAQDSRILKYQGPLVTENPFEKIKIKLTQSKLTQKLMPEFQIIDMKLHPELVKNLQNANGSLKVDCHLERSLNGAETLALGQVKMKSGQSLVANKKTIVNAGMVVCERVDHSPFTTKNELEKFRGQTYRIGPGKDVHVIITSNQVPSPVFNFCGGTRLLDFRLLILDDGRVIQQRADVVNEFSL